MITTRAPPQLICPNELNIKPHENIVHWRPRSLGKRLDPATGPASNSSSPPYHPTAYPFWPGVSILAAPLTNAAEIQSP
jgi:hypothetical protein